MVAFYEVKERISGFYDRSEQFSTQFSMPAVRGYYTTGLDTMG